MEVGEGGREGGYEGEQGVMPVRLEGASELWWCLARGCAITLVHNSFHDSF